ncbi:hypothetical protein [Variovorax terrae]|uniref:DUF5666 domain-containing protein n=1 Tax=Variovorax terrae TaxID=2923278 RepID=A0A9X2ANU3_9BURK|nr:hypothetical protein [Variovorax terrae]MCJ0765183.1 hypothetical protein [Variovorax terrae]
MSAVYFLCHGIEAIARRWPVWTRFGAWLSLAAVVLHGCGGGMTTAGVGSGGSGLAEGTVSGFGSVIVDGVEYDDSGVAAQAADGSGGLRTADLKLGQRVRLVYNDSRQIDSIQVLPQLVGPASSAIDDHGWMQVMGQWVRVVKSQQDASRSGPTVLSGYSEADRIMAGDELEVHGTWVYDERKASHVLVATRVEKLAAPADSVQLAGVVRGLTDGSFRLNASNGTLVQPSQPLPPALANGQVAHLWVARGRLGNAALDATRVESVVLDLQEVARHAQVILSGLVAGYDPATRVVEIQGMRIRLAPGLQVDEAALARGEFASLKVSQADNMLVASDMTLRSAAAGGLGATVEVKGEASGIDWTAATVGFILRGVAIQAASAVVDASCRAMPADVRRRVEVRGQSEAPGRPVTASQVTCSSDTAGSAGHTGNPLQPRAMLGMPVPSLA